MYLSIFVQFNNAQTNKMNRNSEHISSLFGCLGN